MENHVYPFLGRTYALTGACCLKIGARVIIAHRRAAVKGFESGKLKSFRRPFSKGRGGRGASSPSSQPAGCEILCFARSARGELQKQSGGLFLQEGTPCKRGRPLIKRRAKIPGFFACLTPCTPLPREAWGSLHPVTRPFTLRRTARPRPQGEGCVPKGIPQNQSPRGTFGAAVAVC